jgi:hypothetical protein
MHTAHYPKKKASKHHPRDQQTPSSSANAIVVGSKSMQRGALGRSGPTVLHCQRPANKHEKPRKSIWRKNKTKKLDVPSTSPHRHACTQGSMEGRNRASEDSGERERERDAISTDTGEVRRGNQRARSAKHSAFQPTDNRNLNSACSVAGHACKGCARDESKRGKRTKNKQRRGWFFPPLLFPPVFPPERQSNAHPHLRDSSARTGRPQSLQEACSQPKAGPSMHARLVCTLRALFSERQQRTERFNYHRSRHNLTDKRHPFPAQTSAPSSLAHKRQKKKKNSQDSNLESDIVQPSMAMLPDESPLLL